MLSTVGINIFVPFIIEKYIYGENILKFNTFLTILFTGEKLNECCKIKIKFSIIEQTIHVQIGHNNLLF